MAFWSIRVHSHKTLSCIWNRWSAVEWNITQWSQDMLFTVELFLNLIQCLTQRNKQQDMTQRPNTPFWCMYKLLKYSVLQEHALHARPFTLIFSDNKSFLSQVILIAIMILVTPGGGRDIRLETLDYGNLLHREFTSSYRRNQYILLLKKK